MKPILLLHGFFLNPTMWAPQVSLLEALHYRVLTPHLPPSQNSTIDQWTDYLATYIHEHASSPIPVAGLSMGGYVLMALLRNHPSLVSAAIFLDTKANLDPPEGLDARLKMAAEVLATRATENALNSMLPKLLRKNAPESLRAHLRSIMQTVSPESVATCQRAMAQRQDQSSLFPTLKIPTLFLVGSEDALTPPALLKPLADKTPNSTYKEIPSAGHMSNLENPESVNAALTLFLESLPSTPNQ